MGNTTSAPERVYRAARANDVPELRVSAWEGPRGDARALRRLRG